MKKSTKEQLELYKHKGTPPGDFIYAVLTNNLLEAFMQADEQNAQDMKEIVSYCYNDLPSSAWKSKENIKSWMYCGGLEGIS